MSFGQVLAIKIGEWQEMEGGVVITGFRVFLKVNRIYACLQAVILYGDNLFQMTYSPWGAGMVDVGSLSPQAHFDNFLKPFIGKSREYGEFINAPYNPAFYLNRTSVITPPEAEPPTETTHLTLIGNGYDPLKGWWVKFKGNIGSFPLFDGVVPVEGGPPNYSIRIKAGA